MGHDATVNREKTEEKKKEKKTTMSVTAGARK
jgi:hypothetical protein